MGLTVIAKRIEALRSEFTRLGIDGYYIPKVDMFMGEYIRPCDERLEWISGFTGSAGFAIITHDQAALFVDGRYTVQAKSQCPEFEIVHIGNQTVEDWLDGAKLGADASTITQSHYERLREKIDLQFTENPIDLLWNDRPLPQKYEVTQLPLDLAGQSTEQKTDAHVQTLLNLGISAFITNNPESIAWLLNIRGGEIAMLPAPHVFGVIEASGQINIFGMDAPKFDISAQFFKHEDFKPFLAHFNGSIGSNKNALPAELWNLVKDPIAINDPIIAAKARKNDAEVKASQNAHITDAVAMCRFLHWLDEQDHTSLDEITVRDRLDDFRKQDQSYSCPSFDTISGFNQNGAIVHYRVDQDSNLPFTKDGLLLLDSGGHYQGATTDITRTIAIGDGIDAARTPFTAVLEGLANISQAQFPKGYAGRDIDALARFPLWSQKLDYGHGTGHGVGASLSVHEGPASISKRGEVPLEAGMILSLEPGFYAEGEFGIRLENLAVVRESNRFLHFETLTFVPFDKRLMKTEELCSNTQIWLNQYHNDVWKQIAKHLDEPVKSWLRQNTAPI